MRNILKTVLTVAILALLVIVAWKLLKFAIAIVLPIAILLLIAYVVYIAVTGKKP